MIRWIVLICLLATPVRAADFSDPTWPCVQRKIARLSIGQMWAGPPIGDSDVASWRKDEPLARLASRIAIRRTDLTEAEARIAAFAAPRDAGTDARLARLFAGTFQLIDRERSQIIAGIGRYAARQTSLAEKIDRLQGALSGLKDVEPPDMDRIEELEDQVLWETRIYKDRAQSLTYVCETPVILERRAFALARAIMLHLD